MPSWLRSQQPSLQMAGRSSLRRRLSTARLRTRGFKKYLHDDAYRCLRRIVSVGFIDGGHPKCPSRPGRSAPLRPVDGPPRGIRVTILGAEPIRLAIGGVALTVHDIGAYLGPAPQRIPDDVRRALTPEDAARAERFARHDDRVRSLLSRHLVRTALSARIGCDPRTLTYGSNAHGKPRLERPGETGVEFNMSHAGRHVAVAVADAPVGVDIEEVRPTDDLDAVALLQFLPDERAWVVDGGESGKAARFFAVWTRKEALAKAIGCGLGGRAGGLAARPGCDRIDGWSIRSLPGPSGYALAVAWREAQE